MIQATLDRMEREQKVRDDGIRRALERFSDEFQRLQTMVAERVAETHVVMETVSELLTRQTSLVESIQQVFDERGMEDADWDDLPEPPVHPPGG